MTIENPQAFPSRPSHGLQPRHGEVHNGMTLRDWFAGQALPASLDMPHKNGWEAVHREDDAFIELATAHAYRVADAMLAARQEPSA